MNTKLTWRRVLDQALTTPTGRPKLLHYQSNEGHKIVPVEDKRGRVRSYNLHYPNDTIVEDIIKLRDAMWIAEPGGPTKETLQPPKMRSPNWGGKRAGSGRKKS
jgi:hypothetical protein